MQRIIPIAEVEQRRALWREEKKRVVVTNGCFDILHIGHLRYLSSARKLGDILWVGINDDSGVRALKGESRPINLDEERAELLSELRVVDAVTVFEGIRATQFLKLSAPDIYAKGGDYTPESLNEEERKALESVGAKIKILGLVPGRSTSETIKKISS